MKTDTIVLDDHKVDDKPKAHSHFNESEVLHHLKHYLPAQAPLKDFIHHNTLHAFQHEPFYEALQKATEIFGFNVFLGMQEYRKMFKENRIRKDILEAVIIERKGEKLP